MDATPPATPLIVTSRAVGEWRGPPPTTAWAWDEATTARSIQEYFRADKARGQGVLGGDTASQGGSVDVASRFCKFVEVLKPAVASAFPKHVDYGAQRGALCCSTDPALPVHQCTRSTTCDVSGTSWSRERRRRSVREAPRICCS